MSPFYLAEYNNKSTFGYELLILSFYLFKTSWMALILRITLRHNSVASFVMSYFKVKPHFRGIMVM